MAEYIDREAAIDAIDETDWYHQTRNGEMVHGANSAVHQAWYKADDIYKALNAVPSVDVVKVVRCMNCKHWDISDIHSTICPDNRRCKGIFGKMYTEPDYYCAYGERKDV